MITSAVNICDFFRLYKKNKWAVYVKEMQNTRVLICFLI